MTINYEGYLVVLFVDDLEASKDFYLNQMGFRAGHADEHSAGVHVGDHFILLLDHHAAADALGGELVDLAPSRGARQFLVTDVDDVDTAWRELEGRGISFIRPPEDRWWGLRCAYLADPDGNVWEIHSPVAKD